MTRGLTTRRLVMFDVDGTLTRTTVVDAECYARAVTDVLGVAVDTDWSRYTSVTDGGILAEVCRRHGLTAAMPATVENVQRRFFALLREAFATEPAVCAETPGAAALLRRLRALPDISIAIATGGWGTSARLKLRHARIDCDGIALASSDDFPTREGILKAAYDRAAALADGSRFDACVYVGDAAWDAAAARAVGYRFVGIAAGPAGARLTAAGAVAVFDDFRDVDRVIDTLCGP